MNLGVRAKTWFFEENIRVSVHDFRSGNNFLDMTAKASGIKEKNR